MSLLLPNHDTISQPARKIKNPFDPSKDALTVGYFFGACEVLGVAWLPKSDRTFHEPSACFFQMVM